MTPGLQGKRFFHYTLAGPLLEDCSHLEVHYELLHSHLLDNKSHSKSPIDLLLALVPILMLSVTLIMYTQPKC